MTALQTAQKALHFFRVLSLFSHVSPAATFSWHHSIGFLLTHGGGGNGGGNGGAAGWPGGMGGGGGCEGGDGGIGLGGISGGDGGVLHRPQESRHFSRRCWLRMHSCCIPESLMLRQKKSDSVFSHGGGLRGGCAGGEGSCGGGGCGTRLGGKGGAM